MNCSITVIMVYVLNVVTGSKSGALLILGKLGENMYSNFNVLEGSAYYSQYLYLLFQHNSLVLLSAPCSQIVLA